MKGRRKGDTLQSNIPIRSICDNITLIRDVLEVSELLVINTDLISLDHEMAFDWVKHLYLCNTLHCFWFQSGF